MTQYQVIIEETVSQAFTVPADNPQQARYIATVKYDKGEFVLEPGHPTQARISVHASDGSELLPFEEL